MLSPFDSEARGTLLGEGAAFLALKRLEDAGLECHRVENRVYFKDPDGLEGQVAGRYSSRPGRAP